MTGRVGFGFVLTSVSALFKKYVFRLTPRPFWRAQPLFAFLNKAKPLTPNLTRRAVATFLEERFDRGFPAVSDRYIHGARSCVGVEPDG